MLRQRHARRVVEDPANTAHAAQTMHGRVTRAPFGDRGRDALTVAVCQDITEAIAAATAAAIHDIVIYFGFVPCEGIPFFPHGRAPGIPTLLFPVPGRSCDVDVDGGERYRGDEVMARQ